ncbi:MAG: methionyl-tRNA formyltransferase [Verrucomicrobiota bacterium]
MRIVYLGTGEIGIPALAWLMDSPQVELAGVVTQPDRPAGRGEKLRAGPVKVWAQERGLAIQQPASVNKPDALAELAAWQPDLIVVCAFGQILKQPLLELPPQGCINIHASLLPRHRGASCIQAALLAGDECSGITIIQMDAGLDTGDMLAKRLEAIEEHDTAAVLHDRLAELAPAALEQAVSQIINGTVQPEVQIEAEATYAPKLARQDGEIDWSQPVREIATKMRALYSWPGSYTFYQNARGERKRVKLLPPVRVDPASTDEVPAGALREDESGDIRVAAGNGELVLGQVQPEGSKVMTAAAWARGVDLSQKLG